MNSNQTHDKQSLTTWIREAAGGNNGITFVGSAAGDAELLKITWNELYNDALKAAAYLQQCGCKPGDNIAILGLTSRPLVTALQAVWHTGGCVNMLPIPMRMNSITEFITQTRTTIAYTEARVLLIDDSLASFYQPQAEDPPVIKLSELEAGCRQLQKENYFEPENNPDRLAILQFTSGSTSVPKGVMLPHHVICANIDAMDQVVKLDLHSDTLVSWLPLYHDMGLIGILTTSMAKGCNLVLAAPQDFLSKPADWMRWMSSHQGTITAGPNFSYVLATRALQRMTKSGDILKLDRVRMALNGAEPIDPGAVEKFIDAASGHGFRKGAEFCAFGMAEVSIGGTFPPVMRGMVCDTVDRKALEAEKYARPQEKGLPGSRRLPLLGSPLPGLQMRICDPETGTVLENRKVGELQVKGTSVTTGYYKRPDLTGKIFDNGWLRTGDLGYFVKGPGGGPDELVICGRIKDVIIIAGRNIYPDDIERATATVEGVRPGNVIAFGIEGSKGKESVVVVAEIKSGDLEEIRNSIRYRVLSACGIPPKDICLVQKGSLPKTSSGKLQRSLCKDQYLNHTLLLEEPDV